MESGAPSAVTWLRYLAPLPGSVTWLGYLAQVLHPYTPIRRARRGAHLETEMGEPPGRLTWPMQPARASRSSRT